VEVKKEEKQGAEVTSGEKANQRVGRGGRVGVGKSKGKGNRQKKKKNSRGG